ncbi:MAG: hypothetical protein FWC20_09600 [Oscillospiraceae bacterium]|nr:hypothetical protein [Oscillospiraceae bacterium]MCL2279644.1 hypothetical protein [Oscillospiraceae bacterium]
MDNLKLFIEKAKGDEKLMAKLNEIGKDSVTPEKIEQLAAEYGITVPKDELDKLCYKKCGILTEGDLEEVAGGDADEDHFEDVDISGWPTQNRFDPAVCPGVGQLRYECRGFMNLVYCDHYSKTYSHTRVEKYKGKGGGDRRTSIFDHVCSKGGFNYKAPLNG